MDATAIITRTRLLPRWVLAVVVLQVGVPAAVLVGTEPPSRFGFQMYSGMGGVRVEARTAEGDRVDVPDDLVAAMLRPDVPWLDHLPEHVCERLPQASTVTVEQDGERRQVSC